MRTIIQLQLLGYAHAYHTDVAENAAVVRTQEPLANPGAKQQLRAIRRRLWSERQATADPLPSTPTGRQDVGLVIIYTGAIGWRDGGYLRRVRRKYPFAQLSLFITNKISNPHAQPTLDSLPTLMKLYDKVVTFDSRDAEQFGLLHHPVVLGRIPSPAASPAGSSDLFYTGWRRAGRLELLADLAARVRGAGGSTDFSVTGVDKSQRPAYAGINWEPLDYPEYVGRLLSSHTMGDIAQDGGGTTLRPVEALLYGRRLLTDNLSAASLPFAVGQLILVRDLGQADMDLLLHAQTFAPADPLGLPNTAGLLQVLFRGS